MNEDKTSPILERSTLVRGLRWLFSSSGLRSLLITLVWVVTVLALIYGEENWRGRRAWNRYRRQAEAKGEQLDYSALIPKPVRDEDNFAATRFVAAIFQRNAAGELTDPFTDRFQQASERLLKAPGDEFLRARRMTDLVAWQEAFAAVWLTDKGSLGKRFEQQPRDPASQAQAAPAVLEALKPDEPIFEELRAASHRPSARYPLNYNAEQPYAVLLPHLAKLKGLCQRLQLRACAELALGRDDAALQDLTLCLDVADSIRDEPTVISYLVRVACVQLAVQPLWEGLVEHRWSERELVALESRFQHYNFVEDCAPALGMERAAALAAIDFVRRTGRISAFIDLPGVPNDNLVWSMSDVLCRVLPGGWFDLEKLNYCRLMDDQARGVSDPAARRVFPAQVETNKVMIERRLTQATLASLVHHRLMARVLLPALSRVWERGAAAQVVADQSTLACALERYRLANAHFPATLDALSPHWMTSLPEDTVGAQSYHYRLTDDGGYVLYSVGWDGKDDGGKPGKRQFDDKRGDWVWECPGTPHT